jgi:tetratricopeptide (TPR) repeat protein
LEGASNRRMRLTHGKRITAASGTCIDLTKTTTNAPGITAMAVQLDPTFARAYAGLSFSHFQNAFQGWAQREPEVARAYEAARESLIVDDRDPAAHLAIGRALWLRGRHEQSIVELEQAVDLSPNFALAHYTLAFVHSQTGNPHAAVAFSDHSRELSPLLYAGPDHVGRCAVERIVRCSICCANSSG